MADSLANRLKKIADEKKLEEAAGEDRIAFQRRVDDLITKNAQPEYENLLRTIERLVAEVNPSLGDLPRFQFSRGTFNLQQGNCVSSVRFTKPYINEALNRLHIAFGTHPHAMYIDQPPEPDRYEFVAAATDALDGIVWIGDLGEMTTEELGTFVVERLTVYYLDHKPANYQ
jgi:hypothetical protein